MSVVAFAVGEHLGHMRLSPTSDAAVMWWSERPRSVNSRALGHDRFALVGHDRGALVAFRAGLDHPEVITHLGCLDVVPALDTL